MRPIPRPRGAVVICGLCFREPLHADGVDLCGLRRYSAFVSMSGCGSALALRGTCTTLCFKPKPYLPKEHYDVTEASPFL
jgi:hypothetical protein